MDNFKVKYLVLFLVFITAGQVCAGEVYKWIDEDGKVHYGPRPANPQAEQTRIDVESYISVTIEDGASGTDSRKVVMFATSWCGYCKKAREYFAQNSIPYKEYDIEKSTVGKRKYDKLGATGVPVILVGDKRMNGFNEAGFLRIYNPTNISDPPS